MKILKKLAQGLLILIQILSFCGVIAILVLHVVFGLSKDVQATQRFSSTPILAFVVICGLCLVGSTTLLRRRFNYPNPDRQGIDW